MPAKYAKLYLDMVAQFREVAGIAAQLRANISASTARTDDVIFGTFVHAQSMAARALLRLDNHSASPETFDFEKESWQCEVNVQSARQCIRAVAVYAGASQTKLLEMMAASL
eukprot:7964046-Pyramimonas_sp.AAC.1